MFCFNDTATTEIYTLSLHDALPIFRTSFNTFNTIPLAFSSSPYKTGFTSSIYQSQNSFHIKSYVFCAAIPTSNLSILDRKSTRLNSSHANISYAVFCLKKKRDQPIS